MGKVQKMRIGSLEALHRPAAAEDSPAVLLLHGYGADQGDLLPLADMMDPKSKFHWYFPNGLLEVIIAPGFTGRAWFQIDLAEYEAAMKEGRLRDLSKNRPEGFDNALAEVNSFFQELQDRHSKVFLGGFSQGAMLSTELAFISNPLPAGLAILSGAFLDAENWRTLSKKARGLNFIQSHGQNDALLPPKGAKDLYMQLRESGLEGQFLDFTGGHEIPMTVVEKVAQFIREQLS